MLAIGLRALPLVLALCAPLAASADASPQPGLRDVLHRLESWAEAVPSPAPDLTILTTQPIPNTTSSGFGWRDDPIRHDERFHTGTDFRADPGTPVLAAGDGIVVFAGRQGGYGNIIYVDHGGGVVTRYAHLQKIQAAKGDIVAAGRQIGAVGRTGRATGYHLHFEIRLDGRAVDPVLAMTVAELEREQPEVGRLAAFALTPELQQHARDEYDEHPHRGGRPERADRSARQQVLW